MARDGIGQGHGRGHRPRGGRGAGDGVPHRSPAGRDELVSAAVSLGGRRLLRRAGDEIGARRRRGHAAGAGAGGGPPPAWPTTRSSSGRCGSRPTRSCPSWPSVMPAVLELFLRRDLARRLAARAAASRGRPRGGRRPAGPPGAVAHRHPRGLGPGRPGRRAAAGAGPAAGRRAGGTPSDCGRPTASPGLDGETKSCLVSRRDPRRLRRSSTSGRPAAADARRAGAPPGRGCRGPASPAGACARRRSTTSPARPASAGPPPTGRSPAARTAWSRPCSATRPGGCSPTSTPPWPPPATLEDLLVVGVGGGPADHGPTRCCGRCSTHEPELVLPHFAFDRLDRCPRRRRPPCAAPTSAASCPTTRSAPPPSCWPGWSLSFGLPARRLARHPRPRLAVRRLVRTYLVPAPVPPTHPATRRTVMSHQRRADRPRRRQRPRGDPRRSPTPTSTRPSTRCRTTPTPSSRGTTRRARRPALNRLYEKAKTSQWNGETDLPWDTEVDQEAVVIANASARHGRADPAASTVDVAGTPFAKWDREGVDPARRREPELDAQPVHARRAGRAAVHGQDRRDGAVDRRQVLRVDPGHGRGPPRRGVRQVPRHQAVGPLPDQRPPASCCSTTSSTTAAGT